MSHRTPRPMHAADYAKKRGKVPRLKMTKAQLDNARAKALKEFEELVVWKDQKERQITHTSSKVLVLEEKVDNLEKTVNSRGTGDARINLVEVQSLLRKMLEYCPEYFPECAKGHDVNMHHVSQKELDECSKAPFFSESYLYNLMGKEEARVVLSLFTRLCKELGVNPYA